MNITQKRVIMVLGRMIEMCKENPEDADMFSEMLDTPLMELNGEDAFGTEGQNDPRGDFREGSWSMSHVDGVD